MLANSRTKNSAAGTPTGTRQSGVTLKNSEVFSIDVDQDLDAADLDAARSRSMLASISTGFFRLDAQEMFTKSVSVTFNRADRRVVDQVLEILPISIPLDLDRCRPDPGDLADLDAAGSRSM